MKSSSRHKKIVKEKSLLFFFREKRLNPNLNEWIIVGKVDFNVNLLILLEHILMNLLILFEVLMGTELDGRQIRVCGKFY